MANEISVRTQYTFLSEDGTTYSRDNTYFSDATSAATSPLQYVFYAEAAASYAISFSGGAFAEQNRSSAMLYLINRDDRRDMLVELADTLGGLETRRLGPKEWVYLDVCEMNQSALGGGGAFTYAARPISQIQVQTDSQSARGELLSILKSAS